ncbi:MAG TPA: ABC transporter ATP-binding protein [Vicinamibacterales bacterium]|nr:ABC transporter ATP-binding protein [Vicinamibacterales bacterium]
MTQHVSVRVEHVSKTYRIPRPDAPTMRDYVRRPAWALRAPKSQVVDALRDVSFELHEGEVLGIIGRNGAGKSTLLKVLSRITSPTTGRVTMRGHVASLLEVGTGFHPELTGRENIYLNGMLLGMSSKQVSQVFDAICEFASVGDYINVPIKRYSSGMQLRLAFSVAAHLRADTMIVDEVLAVGDAEFQRKCLGAMQDVSREGRTTLFVSHNMSAIEALCTRVIWLDGGAIRGAGSTDEIVRSYLRAGMARARQPYAVIDLVNAPRGFQLGGATVKAIGFHRIGQPVGNDPWHVSFAERFALEVSFDVTATLIAPTIGIAIRNDRGEDILTSHSSDLPTVWPFGGGDTTGRVTIESPWLRPGSYFIEVAILSGGQLLDHVSHAATLTVDEQSADDAPPLQIKKGVVAPLWKWDVCRAAVRPMRSNGNGSST